MLNVFSTTYAKNPSPLCLIAAKQRLCAAPAAAMWKSVFDPRQSRL
jgi:hypothetical protein